MTTRCTAVVPTLGASPFLEACLRALRESGGSALEIVVVDQAPEALTGLGALANQVVRFAPDGGFTAANNRAFSEIRTPFVATVNDDALVDLGWLEHLLQAMEDHPNAAAAQGVVRSLDDPSRIDGLGLGWNRHGQAIQLGHGTLIAETCPAHTQKIFGVSATVAVYRRTALEQMTATPANSRLGPVFDERLGSYYEDVDLACRLRAAGWSALCVPAATARHAGSTSSGRNRLGSGPLVYANRHLVLAKMLGRSFWPRLPHFALRDLTDLGRATLDRDWPKVAGIAAGWGRAITQLPRFAHFGSALLPPRDLVPRS